MNRAALVVVLVSRAASAGPPQVSETRFDHLVAGADGVWIGGHRNCSEAGRDAFLVHADATRVAHGTPHAPLASTGSILIGPATRSANGGRTWSPGGATASSITAAWAGDGGLVIAVGLDGAILRSTNAGESWKSVASGTAATLLGVSGAGTMVVAVGVDGAIVASTDGGATWRARRSGTTAVLRGVWVGSPTEVIAIGDTRDIFVQRDGGRFAAVRPAVPADATFTQIVGSGSDLYALGPHAQRSRDKGATWQPLAGDLARAQFLAASGRTLYALTPRLFGATTTHTDATILRSTNGGGSWQPFQTILLPPRLCRDAR